MKARFLDKLQERKDKGSLRSLSLFEGMIDFCSNDYLGMSKTESQPAVYAGSTGSRLISGNSTQAEETERFLASFFGSEAALIFNSGYDANVGLFSSVPQKGDTVLYDELIHASVRDGIRLSHAKAYSFRHNDLADLEKKFNQAEGSVFVAVESLYSMDGDQAPLAELVIWCEQKDAYLIVDEAHAGGVYGDSGKGLLHELGLHERCFARLYTFGKAFGTHGAVICGSEQLKEYLYNFARSFIYSTALPPNQYVHIKESVERSANNKIRRDLKEVISQFRSLINTELMISDPSSPIQVIPVSTLERCLLIARKMQENNLAVKAILPPTVPENGQRLRICLHSYNTESELDLLAKLLNELVD
ncbi:MAG: 8-amino-7-oxononanoate synthase [Flavobacteriia bacterium]|nr:8-amino-7-oxononanoate synthase [Flavobacteriia bacterium]